LLYALSRSGTADAGKDVSPSQPNKRFQQTQAQVDEVRISDVYFDFSVFWCVS